MKDNVSGCPVEEAMIRLGGRWKMMILSFLLGGKKRFNEIRKSIPNISQRMLTLELRSLEKEGLISRTIFPEVPVRVEYALTDDGLKLEALILSLREIGSWFRQRQENQIQQVDDVTDIDSSEAKDNKSNLPT